MYFHPEVPTGIPVQAFMTPPQPTRTIPPGRRRGGHLFQESTPPKVPKKKFLWLQWSYDGKIRFGSSCIVDL